MSEPHAIRLYAALYITREVTTAAGVQQELLLCLRTGTGLYDGYYALIGGKVEHNESLLQACIREALEEVGITILPHDAVLKHVHHFIDRDRPAIAFVYGIKSWQGEPFNKESEKHGSIGWFNLKNLPMPITPSNTIMIEHIKRGSTYSDDGF